MTDYIKREDAIKIINSGISIDTDADKRYVNGLFRAIRPADVAPVRHGHWIDDAGALRCSECGVSFPDLHPLYENAAYCPNCGARMDGENDE